MSVRVTEGDDEHAALHEGSGQKAAVGEGELRTRTQPQCKMPNHENNKPRERYYYIEKKLEELEKQEANGGRVEEVRAHRVNPKARQIEDLTLEQLTSNRGMGVYIPSEHKSRILRLYGGFTTRDFDDVFDLNGKIGSIYPNGLLTIVHYIVEGTLAEQLQRFYNDPVSHEILNIVQSIARFCMRTRTTGNCMDEHTGDVWYFSSYGY